MNELETLIAAAENVSKLWRLGQDKSKWPERDVINALDAAVSACKKRLAKDATTIIERKP